jgi:hypothetical protein
MGYKFIVLETRPRLLETRSSSAVLKNAGVTIIALDSLMAFRLRMLEFRDLLVNLVLFWILTSPKTPLYKTANVVFETNWASGLAICMWEVISSLLEPPSVSSGMNGRGWMAMLAMGRPLPAAVTCI